MLMISNFERWYEKLGNNYDEYVKFRREILKSKKEVEMNEKNPLTKKLYLRLLDELIFASLTKWDIVADKIFITI